LVALLKKHGDHVHHPWLSALEAEEEKKEEFEEETGDEELAAVSCSSADQTLAASSAERQVEGLPLLDVTTGTAAPPESQIDQELGDHKSDRKCARKDAAEATAVQDKERSDYEAGAVDSKTNIGKIPGPVVVAMHVACTRVALHQFNRSHFGSSSSS